MPRRNVLADLSTPAKHQSFSKGNPRSLLLDIVNRNPDDDENLLRQKFIDQVFGDEGCLTEIANYWFTLNFRSLYRAPERDTHSNRGSASFASHKARITRGIIKIKLLNMMMPSGKQLSDSTGDECIALGGWLETVGELVGSRRVGRVLSEDDLQKMWRGDGSLNSNSV